MPWLSCMLECHSVKFKLIDNEMAAVVKYAAPPISAFKHPQYIATQFGSYLF